MKTHFTEYKSTSGVLARFTHVLVFKDTYQTLHFIVVTVQLYDITEEASSHWCESIGRPVTEPINGTAIDQGRELSESSSEDLTNWTAQEIGL